MLPDWEFPDSINDRNLLLTNLAPSVWSGKIFCESDDKQHVVFEASSLFRSLDELSPIGTRSAKGLSIKATIKSDRCSFDSLKAFADNVSIKSTLSYSVTTSFLGLLSVLRDAPVNVQTTHSVLLLPERKMIPRLADSRIGTFLTNRRSLSTSTDKIETYSVINRWRLEPRDSAAWQRGKLTEPVKPIVFYLDDAFPPVWREAARRGILRWNKAFEAIGFKNVLHVEMFPNDDPEFDPDNLKYSCVRYVPTAISNAMGPSWVDPSTGEIINASVIVYHDVAKLINNWRFCQTAQIDERVRAIRMPDEIMEESLEYVLAHEVGHCLGFMHNMAASAAYPVDSLRSASFTRRHGTTPSIMDYARFNYIAQPEDKGVGLTPPDLGVYDYFLVQYTYQPIPEARTMKEEQPVLDGWIKEHDGDPRYRYGRQQVSFRCDPSAIEEDLGDDPLRSSDYGVANLKYILANLDTWIPDADDADNLHREELYGALLKQYDRYVQAVLLNVGGIMLYDRTDHPRVVAVNAERQRLAVRWVLDRLADSDWIDQTSVGKRMSLHVDNQTKFATETFGDLLDKLKSVVLAAHVAQDEAYTPEEFLVAIYDRVWKPIQRNKPLTASERMMQNLFVEACISAFAPKSHSSSGGKSLTATAAYSPSLHQFTLLEEVPMPEDLLMQAVETYGWDTVGQRMFGEAGYNWQKRVSIKTIDETPALWYEMARQSKKLLIQKMAMANAGDRAHYNLLLYRLHKALAND